MNYKLIIDKTAEEQITVVAHGPSALTQQIEDLVRSFSGTDSLMGYREDGMRKLAFSDIDAAVKLGLEYTLEHLKKQGAEVSPESRAALACL